MNPSRRVAGSSGIKKSTIPSPTIRIVPSSIPSSSRTVLPACPLWMKRRPRSSKRRWTTVRRMPVKRPKQPRSAAPRVRAIPRVRSTTRSRVAQGDSAACWVLTAPYPTPSKGQRHRSYQLENQSESQNTSWMETPLSQWTASIHLYSKS